MDSSTTMSPGTPGTLDCCGTFACLPFFVAGIVGLAVVEFLLVLYLLERLMNLSSSPSASPIVSDLKIQSVENSISLQGNAWVAPVPENTDLSKVIVKQIRKAKRDKDGGQKDGSRRGEGTKDALEIAPMRRYAFLKDKALLLRAPDGTEEEISLEGCEVLTVSSSPGESRKWGKKFPIKLRHPDRPLYRGCKTFLFYAQSGYAKEAWCQAFRAMAKTGHSLSQWTFETKGKYREYTHAAEENMPYLTKFYAGDDSGLVEVKQKEEAEGPLKKRTMWRKLARKASLGRDHKETRFAHAVDEVQRRKQPRNSQVHDDKAWNNKETAFYDEGTNVSVAESATPVVDPNFDRATSLESLANSETDVSASESSNNTASARMQKDNRESGDQVPAAQQKARKAKGERADKEIEQGVLCLNMIVARLYYDFNQSQRRFAGVDRFFLRLLMKIRKPSYMKSITIKELDLGRHPPFATAIRILPSDGEGALAMEIDLEWHGGGHLTCETRLDLKEQSTQEKVAAQLAESGSEGDVTAAVLSGLRGDFDAASSASFSAAVQEGRQADLPNKKGRWMQSVKSMLSHVADHVSQVPLVLKIKLVSLRGTVVLKLKAPPSDRVWFAFKTMPDIHFEPEPCIGEHRISSGAVARLIANQIKVQIRESVVLPYCEDFFLNWMMADKDNWLSQSTFPFPFFDSQSSEAERETFKQMAETYSSSSDESGRPGHQPLPRPQNTRNAQNKPPKGQASKSAIPGPFKLQKHAQGSNTNSAQPSTYAQVPKHDLLKPRRSSSDLLFSRFSAPKPPRSSSTDNLKTQASVPNPPRSDSSDHLNAQASVPKPPRSASKVHRLSALVSDPVQSSGSTALSLASPVFRKESRPLLKFDVSQENDESQNEEAWESARDLNLGTLRMAMDTRPKDFSSHSEGSASESDVQFLATQVANPEDLKEPDHSSKITRRARMSSLRKKVLDEVRHNVVEKLHHKRPDDIDGSAQASGRWANEAPFA